jgi:hypothetical protein
MSCHAKKQGAVQLVLLVQSHSRRAPLQACQAAVVAAVSAARLGLSGWGRTRVLQCMADISLMRCCGYKMPSCAAVMRASSTCTLVAAAASESGKLLTRVHRRVEPNGGQLSRKFTARPAAITRPPADAPAQSIPSDSIGTYDSCIKA